MAALLHDLADRGLLETTLVVWMGEFVATIYNALGIDHAQEITVGNRPLKITDEGKPVHELFA